ncbi:hypothetical protein NDU88_003699 [Pleurodeles waltl]|uniref:Uncharacterized protein n=1 Tax=Pleurodeles waltl TaxID=8319 RepID=A0AAV7NRL1_PLEWA|nr:hypothetical protein NDU88_003699 [Pleurodeles waltl]
MECGVRQRSLYRGLSREGLAKWDVVEVRLQGELEEEFTETGMADRDSTDRAVKIVTNTSDAADSFERIGLNDENDGIDLDLYKFDSEGSIEWLVLDSSKEKLLGCEGNERC